jgi:hypothetical protein
LALNNEIEQITPANAKRQEHPLWSKALLFDDPFFDLFTEKGIMGC